VRNQRLLLSLLRRAEFPVFACKFPPSPSWANLLDILEFQPLLAAFVPNKASEQRIFPAKFPVGRE
jgi:hypothetical protein